MKVWKLVSGILSIVLSVFVLFQAGLVGVANTMSENGEVGGSGGLFVSILMLAGGIVSIATRKGGKGGSIAVFVIFLMAALLGFSMAGSYSDLMIWAGWCLICAVFSFFSIFIGGKKMRENNRIE